MLFIKAVQCYIPNEVVLIDTFQSDTYFPLSMVKIFKLFHGVKTVAVCRDLTMFALLCKPIEKLMQVTGDSLTHLDYFIHAHTSQLLVPFGRSLMLELKEHFGFHQAITFGTSLYKCVSAIKLFEVLSILFQARTGMNAIILTGEIAFTPELRILPRTAVVGDAAAAVWVTNEAGDHQLLSVTVHLEKGYSKGLYLSDEESKAFEALFFSTLKKVISETLIKAGLALSDIALILPHNVNHAVWRNMAILLQYPLHQVFTDNISTLGHCFSADALINLVSAEAAGRLKKGDYYLMVGCGMGFFFGCAVFRY